MSRVPVWYNFSFFSTTAKQTDRWRGLVTTSVLKLWG